MGLTLAVGGAPGRARTPGRGFRSKCAVLLGLSAAAAPLSAMGQDTEARAANEWRVVTSRVSAVLTTEDDGADVHVRYVLTGTGSGLPSTAVDVGLLLFEGTAVTDILVEGLAQPVVLWPTSGQHRSASFMVPLDSTAAGGVPLNVSYHVTGAVRDPEPQRIVRIPIVSAPAPVEALPGHFRAEVRIPGGWAISEPVPSGLRAVEGVYETSLPVTPAMIGFRAATDGVRRFGFPRLIDLITLTVLLVFSGLGWRHMRRIQS